MRSQYRKGGYSLKNEAVLRLFSKYSDDLYRFALSYTGSKCEAEDIVQDVFVKLIAKPFIINKEKEKSYLLKMTANACKDYFRSSRYKSQVDIDDFSEVLRSSDENSKEDDQLIKTLDKMETIYRMPIYLHYYEGYSYKEISKILKISGSAVAMRISRGKEVLKNLLEE